MPSVMKGAPWCPFQLHSRPSPHTRRRQPRFSRTFKPRQGTAVASGTRSREDRGRGGAAVAGEPRPLGDRSRGGTAAAGGMWTRGAAQFRGGIGGGGAGAAERGRPWRWRGGGNGGGGRGEGWWWFRTTFSADRGGLTPKRLSKVNRTYAAFVGTALFPSRPFLTVSQWASESTVQCACALLHDALLSPPSPTPTPAPLACPSPERAGGEGLPPNAAVYRCPPIGAHRS